MEKENKPSLSVKNLVKNYGKLTAVNKINIDLFGGDIFGFIGPNGAGKTTTIKCIAGLLDFSEGEISVNGYNIKTNGKIAKSRIGFVPDAPFLYEKLTGREFLFFVGRLFDMKKTEIEKAIDEYSSILEFADYMDIKTEEYSHGMKQRIVIGSAFIHDPDILLVDEPMVGLDPKSSRIVKDLFRNSAEKNKILFISTHTLSLAEEICGKIGIMDKGNMVFSGEISQLKERINKDNLEDIFLEVTKSDEPID